jgi:hypothetical protein|tara:strand:+ start:107 stop:604 length:498 start_codon:yes stop_codon:yes gene_type:complete
MKKLFTLLFLSISVFMFSQENTFTKNYNEIKFNALSTSLGTFEFEFERTINSKSSFGISLFSKFEDTGKAFSYAYDSGANIFYRRYFGKKYTSGLFLEGFGMFHNTKYSRPKISTNLLLGIGIGYKWVSKKGLILQTNFGMGQNIFEHNYDDISGRAGISIGYRF